MSKQAAPWIILTTEKPGLDAQSRNAINEWCGMVGKHSNRRQHKDNLRFPSRAVNWKHQQRPNNDSLKVANLLNDVEGQTPHSARPRHARHTKPSDGTTSKGSATESLTRPATGSRHRSQKKKGSASTETKQCKDELEERSHRATSIFCKDGSMGIRVDPFDCIPGTTADARQGEIVDYYKQILDPGVVATFFVFDMRSTYGRMPLECLMDEDFRPLGLASIAGTMSSVKHAAVNREYILAQLGNGMRLLRQRLSRPGGADADIVLVSIMFLAASAYVTGDLEGFKLHTNKLKQMVAARGGLDNLGYGGGTKTVLLHGYDPFRWDASWKLSTGGSLWVDDRPRKKPIYPPLPLGERTLALVERLPPGFRELCAKGLICVELLDILARMTTAMSYKSSRHIPYDQKVGQYDDYLSVSSLQTLTTPNEEGSTTPPNLEALLTLGLILFSSTAFNEMRAIPVIFRGPKDALYEHLLRLEPDSHEGADDAQNQCYQWLWAVTVDAWRDASRELMPQGRYLQIQFYKRYASNWETSQDLVHMLKRFFWTEDLVHFQKASFESFKAKREER
ncbi:hypothetical protein CLCR_09839 [Cladophialophora carrionii]|uniref:Tachykinin family protein n=1 Tax=Cladophialophora carrionii TaxID=86049 RepID=A0A1C1CZZ8_9EURO|nr:hypothetical protein CLCR_09839 [Cladophialophora carrionii]